MSMCGLTDVRSQHKRGKKSGIDIICKRSFHSNFDGGNVCHFSFVKDQEEVILTLLARAFEI